MYKSDISLDEKNKYLSFGYVLSKEKNLDLNIFEYLNMLLEKGKCDQVKILLNLSHVYDSKNIVTQVLRYLNTVSYGQYYKPLKRSR